MSHARHKATAPVGDIPNTVLGESFVEFLRLGYYGGFGWLEELGYARGTAEAYKAEAPGLSGASSELMQELRDTFRLQPYDDVAAHLVQLEERFASRLVLPDFEVWRRAHGL